MPIDLCKVVADDVQKTVPAHRPTDALTWPKLCRIQTPTNFVFDDSYFLAFIKGIANSDGSLSYFEVLLRSNSLGGQSSHIDVVAVRKEVK